MSLRDEFKDREYRRTYADSFANSVIATQIRLLRGSMTQREFAELVGIKQSRVSAMEDENYSNWSTNTLKRIAAARDVVYLGRFVSFGELLNTVRDFSESSLTVPDFNHDPALISRVSVSVASVSTAASIDMGAYPTISHITVNVGPPSLGMSFIQLSGESSFLEHGGIVRFASTSGGPLVQRLDNAA